MPLPQIPGNPSTAVEQPAATLADIYATMILIRGQPGGTVQVHTTYVPYDYSSGASRPDLPKRLILEDVESLATQRALAGKSALAEAMGAIAAAVAEIVAEQDSGVISPE